MSFFKTYFLHFICNIFAFCVQHYKGNYLDILKKVISIYYRMRKKLTNKVRDQQLLASIINQYTMLSGMGIESLFTRVEEDWKKKRNEWEK